MGQSLSDVVLHIVFSTKDRRRYIDQKIESKLHGYLAGVSKDLGCFPYMVGGIEDHVHLLLGMGKTITQSEVVGKLKSSSSKWMKSQGSNYQYFTWQRGYGVFSVDRVTFDAVKGYVHNQREHHKGRSFKEEFLLLLKRSGIDYDEKFLWD
jgi:putative transposase